ncbi:hypothetical protein [Microcoleus sp. B9-D4]|uniref:hypothetical protein n=1 Tax=Microcoleus sp. B9-D4 TaxID=2818711 RepID=UPI002FCEC419
MKPDLTLISVALSAVVAALSIATSLWKITKLVVAKSRAQEARLNHLHTAVKSLKEDHQDVIYYLSLPEHERGKFYPRRGTRTITKESLQSYDDEHTDFS